MITAAKMMSFGHKRGVSIVEPFFVVKIGRCPYEKNKARSIFSKKKPEVL